MVVVVPVHHELQLHRLRLLLLLLVGDGSFRSEGRPPRLLLAAGIPDDLEGVVAGTSAEAAVAAGGLLLVALPPPPPALFTSQARSFARHWSRTSGLWASACIS